MLIMPTIMRVMLGLLCAMFVYRTWRGGFPTLDLMFAILVRPRHSSRRGRVVACRGYASKLGIEWYGIWD